jgi:hypothetical protein
MKVTGMIPPSAAADSGNSAQAIRGPEKLMPFFSLFPQADLKQSVWSNTVHRRFF